MLHLENNLFMTKSSTSLNVYIVHSFKDNGAIIDLTLAFPKNAAQLKF